MDAPVDFAFDNPKHSDYTLVLKSNSTIHKTIHVNNLILSSYSQYFIALFTNNMKETRQTEIEIELSSYESALFYSIIKSLYTGELVLPSLNELSIESEKSVQGSENENQQTQHNEQEKNNEKGEKKEDNKGKKRKMDDDVEIECENEGEPSEKKQKEEDKGKGKQKEKETEEENNTSEQEDEFPADSEEPKKVQVYLDVIKLLDRFSIQKRFSHCVNLLKKENDSIQSACYHLSILDDLFKHIVEIEEYKKTLLDFLVKEYTNLDKLWQEKDFLSLPNIALKRLLQSDSLLVSCEETILQALRKWINHNPHKRGVYLPELLPLVRFTQIKYTYLTDYVLGYDCFFETKEVCKDFSTFVIGATRYHSFSDLHRKEMGCFQEDKLPDNWSNKRVGYKIKETTDMIDWKCDLSNSPSSQLFYFRGVFYRFALVKSSVDQLHYFCIEPDRLLTSGESDPRLTNVNIKYTLEAFNYQTDSRDIIKFDSVLKGVNIGDQIDQQLKLNETASCYIKPNIGSKRILHLFASFKLNDLNDKDDDEVDVFNGY